MSKRSEVVKVRLFAFIATFFSLFLDDIIISRNYCFLDA